MTWRRAMRRMPIASATVNATGSPSGITETASATEDRKISLGGQADQNRHPVRETLHAQLQGCL